MRTLVSVAVIAALLCGCEGDPPGTSTTEPRPACVPHRDGHARICGLAPPSRAVEGGIEYDVTTVAGERFSVVLPGGLGSGVVAVPHAPIGVKAELTTAAPREAADRFCHGFPECRVVAVARSGVVTRWDDASGAIRDLEVTTVDLGSWTLVLIEPDPARAERAARELTWAVDPYPRVLGAVRIHADWAGMALWVPDVDGDDLSIAILPGCRLSAKRPDLGGADAGPHLEFHEPGTARWCAVGGYAVDVSSAERPQLELLYETLRVRRR